ncbi:hypothetical protein [Propioniferax innocua]|uniref:Leucine rich repeat variant domain-containing protein n=1 Tax=Propioniferax innocua TaxID=1753 RepID=A0A542ZTA0_9ACTN|nr:hypothetical protein [Propioniferax innocua]TQL63470.1 hypothetical protein FB460_1285 [Propioniferax innocua]
MSQDPASFTAQDLTNPSLDAHTLRSIAIARPDLHFAVLQHPNTPPQLAEDIRRLSSSNGRSPQQTGGRAIARLLLPGLAFAALLVTFAPAMTATKSGLFDSTTTSFALGDLGYGMPLRAGCALVVILGLAAAARPKAWLYSILSIITFLISLALGAISWMFIGMDGHSSDGVTMSLAYGPFAAITLAAAMIVAAFIGLGRVKQ